MDLGHNTLQYYKPKERIEEEDPLNKPNLLLNSKITFGERQTHISWNPFALKETELEIDLEKSFQALSLNSKSNKTEPLESRETMAWPESGNEAKEVKMIYLKIFTDDRNKFKRFMQDCNLYLMINNKIYNLNLKK